MRVFRSLTFLLIIAVVMPSLFAAEFYPVTPAYKDSYDDLKPQQKRLFNNLIQKYSKVVKKRLNPRNAYQASPVSVRTTFYAITHALLNSKLSDSNGKSLGTSLGLIESLETIRGKVKGAGGDAQFRMYVILVPNAYEILEKSKQFKRGRNNTIYHKGYPINFRGSGGTPSLQFSMSRDRTRADIDIDYRSSSFPKALFNGHLTAGNSDVRAGNNFGTHVGRWSGLINWWQGLFDLDSLPSIEESIGLSKGQKLPSRTRAGKTKVHNAVSDFLNALLVEGNANEAVGYISSRAYACWELKGETNGKPFNRGLAPYIIREQYKRNHKAIEKAFGKITSLKQIARSIRIDGRPGLRYVKQPFSDEFALYNLQQGKALEWACSNRLTGNTPKKRKSKKYGKYYLAVFRVPAKGVGATVAVLLAKERGYWKIITFEDEPDVDYSNVPDLRQKNKKGEVLKTVSADKSLVSAMRNFHRSWFLKRNYSAALEYFSPAIFSCRNLYLKTGQKPARNLAELMKGWRNGMKKAAEELGVHKTLSSAIRSVTPATNEVAIVKHPEGKAFTIFALSDKSGKAADCSNRQISTVEKGEDLDRLPAGGNYYAASFTGKTSGGSPAVLTTIWRRTDKGWQIYSYRVDTP